MSKKSGSRNQFKGRNTPSSNGGKTTIARNSPLPKSEPLKREISHEMIAKRAYEIYISGKGGTQVDNWLRAERELKA